MLNSVGLLFTKKNTRVPTRYNTITYIILVSLVAIPKYTEKKSNKPKHVITLLS